MMGCYLGMTEITATFNKLVRLRVRVSLTQMIFLLSTQALQGQPLDRAFSEAGYRHAAWTKSCGNCFAVAAIAIREYRNYFRTCPAGAGRLLWFRGRCGILVFQTTRSSRRCGLQ